MDYNEYNEQLKLINKQAYIEERQAIDAIRAKYANIKKELSDKIITVYNTLDIAVGDIITDGEVTIQVENIIFSDSGKAEESYLEFRGTPVSKKTFNPLKRTDTSRRFVQQRYGKFPEILKKNNT